MSSQKDVNQSTFVKKDYSQIKQIQLNLEQKLENFRFQHFADWDSNFVFRSLYSGVFMKYEEPIHGSHFGGQIRVQDEQRMKHIEAHRGNAYNLRQFYNVCQNIQPYMPQIVDVVRYYGIKDKVTNRLRFLPNISICRTRAIDCCDFNPKRFNCPIPDKNFIFELHHPFNKTVEQFVMTPDHIPLRIINHDGRRLFVRYDVYAEPQLRLFQCVNDKYPNVEDPLLKCPTSSRFVPYEVRQTEMIDFKKIFEDQLMVQKLYLKTFLENRYHATPSEQELILKDMLGQSKMGLIDAVLKNLNGVKVVYYQIKHLLPVGQDRCSQEVFNIIIDDFYTRIQEELEDRREDSTEVDESLLAFENTISGMMSVLRPRPQMGFFSSKPVQQLQPQQVLIQQPRLLPQVQQVYLPQQQVVVAVGAAVVDAGVPIAGVVAPVAEAVANAVVAALDGADQANQAQQNQQQNQQQDQQQ